MTIIDRDIERMIEQARAEALEEARLAARKALEEWDYVDDRTVQDIVDEAIRALKNKLP